MSNKEPKVLEKHQPTVISFLVAHSVGSRPEPILYTFIDAHGNTRREVVPL